MRWNKYAVETNSAIMDKQEYTRNTHTQIRPFNDYQKLAYPVYLHVNVIKNPSYHWNAGHLSMGYRFQEDMQQTPQ